MVPALLEWLLNWLQRLWRWLRKYVLPQLSVTSSFSPASGVEGTVAQLTVTALTAAKAPVADGTQVNAVGTPAAAIPRSP
jgi:hypothetical protein